MVKKIKRKKIKKILAINQIKAYNKQTDNVECSTIRCSTIKQSTVGCSTIEYSTFIWLFVSEQKQYKICASHKFEMRPGSGAGMEINMHIGMQIKNINNMIRRRMDNSPVTKKVIDMTGTNAWMIAYIDEKSKNGIDVFQKDIEDTFGVTRSSVSKVIKLMEQKGLVKHQPVEHDARLKKLVLTKKAQELACELKADADRMESQLKKGFTEDEIEQLQSYLERLGKNIE